MSSMHTSQCFPVLQFYQPARSETSLTYSASACRAIGVMLFKEVDYGNLKIT